MTDSSRPVIRTTDEVLVVDQTEFSFGRDGYLEIDIGTHNGDGSWCGRFLCPESVIQLRDYLNKVLP